MLTFDYLTGPRHVLIDFGSTAAAGKGRPLDLTIAADIAASHGGEAPRGRRHTPPRRPPQRLHAAQRQRTGRHHPQVARDADMVQPWTEDPCSRRRRPHPQQRRGRRRFPPGDRSLEAMHQVAAIMRGGPATSPVADEAEAQSAAPSRDPAAVLPPQAQPAPAALPVRRPARDAALPGRDEPEESQGGEEPHDHVHAGQAALRHFGDPLRPRVGAARGPPGRPGPADPQAVRGDPQAAPRRPDGVLAAGRRRHHCPRPRPGVSSPARGPSTAGRSRDPRAGSSPGSAPSAASSSWSSSAASTTP